MALLVVGLAVVGSLQAVSGALRSQAEASRHAEATALADGRLNEIALLDADSLAGLGTTRWRTRRLGDRVYRERSAVDTAAGGRGLWRATTEVAWDGGGVRLQTVLYRPDSDVFGGASP